MQHSAVIPCPKIVIQVRLADSENIKRTPRNEKITIQKFMTYENFRIRIRWETNRWVMYLPIRFNFSSFCMYVHDYSSECRTWYQFQIGRSLVPAWSLEWRHLILPEYIKQKLRCVYQCWKLPRMDSRYLRRWGVSRWFIFLNGCKWWIFFLQRSNFYKHSRLYTILEIVVSILHLPMNQTVFNTSFDLADVPCLNSPTAEN